MNKTIELVAIIALISYFSVYAVVGILTAIDVCRTIVLGWKPAKSAHGSPKTPREEELYDLLKWAIARINIEALDSPEYRRCLRALGR